MPVSSVRIRTDSKLEAATAAAVRYPWWQFGKAQFAPSNAEKLAPPDCILGGAFLWSLAAFALGATIATP
jgi:hypothetical protein